MIALQNIVNDFIELFFPRFCKVCNNRLNSQEKYVCLNCWFDLPTIDNNAYKFDEIFWGKVKIERVVSLFKYRAGSNYQQIIKEIKYRGDKKLGVEMGKRLAKHCIKHNLLNNIDIIIPVPLHKKKLKKRTFNQSEMIAKGLAQELNVEINTHSIIREKFTATQTKKSKYERWENVKDACVLNDSIGLKDKHILIVDDVLTTGSTIEACANVLFGIEDVKISVATLAVAVD